MKKVLLVLAGLGILVLGSAAQACVFESVVPDADCDGWSISGTLGFGSATVADVDYAITLWQGGVEVQTAEGMTTVLREDPNFSFSGMWEGELCGDYTVTGMVHLTADNGSDHTEEFSIDQFTCQCPSDLSITGDADCDGWSISGEVQFGSANTADVDYSITLWQEGLEEQTAEGSLMVDSGMPSFNVVGSWEGELCGDFTVTGTVHMVAGSSEDTEEFSVDEFTCICEESCTYTPGYWKNHEDDWPLLTLTIGGDLLDQEDLLEILNTPTRHDATVILGHHLVAAMLNVASGADDGIQDTIDDANELLADHEVYSDPEGPVRSMALSLKDLLAAYNQLPCDDDEGDEEPGMDSMRMLLPDKSSPAGESQSWGSLKSKYR
jgi:hypothetical protein